MMIKALIAGLVLLALSAFVGWWYWRLIESVKKEVSCAPRVQMFLCDKHGAFPASGVMKITVPAEGMAPLEVDMCPFCYDEKMKSAEKIFKT